MADLGGSALGLEALDEVHALRARLDALEKGMSTLLLRFGEQEQELINLAQIVMAMQAASIEQAATPPPAPAPAAAPAPPAAAPVALSPALGNVLKLVHAGQAEEAKAALAAVPAEERNAHPSVLAITAAALCIAREDYANAQTAIGKARQLTDDPRLLRIVGLVAQRIPA